MGRKKELSEADREKAVKTINKMVDFAGIYVRNRLAEEYAKEKVLESGEDYEEFSEKTKLKTSDSAIIAFNMLNNARRRINTDGKPDVLDRAVDISQHVNERKRKKRARYTPWTEEDDEALGMEIFLVVLVVLLLYFISKILF